jgi:hypothetical protein
MPPRLRRAHRSCSRLHLRRASRQFSPPRSHTGSAALPAAAHRFQRQPRFHWSVIRSDQPPAVLHVLPARLALPAWPREPLPPLPAVPPNQLASFRKIGFPGGSEHRCTLPNLPLRFPVAALVVVRASPPPYSGDVRCSSRTDGFGPAHPSPGSRSSGMYSPPPSRTGL